MLALPSDLLVAEDPLGRGRAEVLQVVKLVAAPDDRLAPARDALFRALVRVRDSLVLGLWEGHFRLGFHGRYLRACELNVFGHSGRPRAALAKQVLNCGVIDRIIWGTTLF